MSSVIIVVIIMMMAIDIFYSEFGVEFFDSLAHSADVKGKWATSDCGTWVRVCIPGLRGGRTWLHRALS
jgi:hypothetical protein